MRRVVVYAVVTVLTLVATSCGGAGNVDEGDEGVELTVSAAASLTAAFTDIGEDFEAAHEGVRVLFNFGPSDGLATQITESGGVDVFASASPAWMEAVAEDLGVTHRADLARNRLAIIVPTDDPAGISSLEDLAEPGVHLVLAAEGVPAGDYAREVLANAGITDAAMANVVSNEEDVKGVITKVLSGDADAGIAYATDVTAGVAEEIALVEIPDHLNVIATYPIAVVQGTERRDLAEAFVEFVLGPGRGTLDGYGFLPA
ncbi:MAG TPA: molybdate ABC transporter substrate-binding protein [Actinomycetota bacterium]|nr:molybdate ABC transporter substrate-binding protein [Actinomycetota bacterium]